MILFQALKAELEEWNRPTVAGSFIIVPTYAIYPSNATVQAYVEGGVNSCIVSDGGGALTELHDVGGFNVRALKYLRDAAHPFGLKVNKSGWIHSDPTSIRQLSASISVVSEASKQAATNLLRHFKPEKDYDFKADFDRFMELSFSKKIERKGKIIGASNKPHSFDYVVDVNSVDKIALDVVTPDPNSINSAIVSHLDVSNANRPNVRQLIVYDDRMRWRASDLSLLSVGAPPVAFQEAQQSLRRLAS